MGEEKSCVKCLGLCGFSRGGDLSIVDVSGGRIIRIRPLHYDWKYSPEEIPVWELKARGKVFRPAMKELNPPLRLVYKNVAFSPTRVKYPLKRVDWDPDGERNPQNRGKSKFVRITWEEAINIIVKEMKRIIEKYGPYAIAILSEGHGQTKGFHGGCHGVPAYLMKHLGGFTWITRNPDSWEGWWWGAKHVWGQEPDGWVKYPNIIHDVVQNTEVILCWGCDYETTNWGWGDQGWSRFGYWLTELGIKQIFICPDLNYAAAVHADKWIPIRPNTDAALQLAIAYVWITEGTYDKEYVKTHCVGFEKFRDYVLGKEDGVPKTPKWAEEITGVPARIIKALARLWARKRTSIWHMSGGPYIRGPYATEPARLEILLLAMQGVGKPGVHQFYFLSLFQSHMPLILPVFPECLRDYSAYLNTYAMWMGRIQAADELMEKEIKQFIPKTLLPDAILRPPISWYSHVYISCVTDCQFKKFTYPAPGCPEIRMLWKTNNCTLTCWNGGFEYAEAYRSPKIEFILAQSPWLENDCLFADIILPVTTPLEEEDYGATIVYNTQYANAYYSPKCIEPVGESKSDFEICYMIAEKLGPALGIPDLPEKFAKGMKTVEEWAKKMWEESGLSMLISLDEIREKGYYIVPLSPTWNDLERVPPGLRRFYENPEKHPLDTPTGKIEFYSERLAKHFPDDKERPPLPHFIPYGETWQESLLHEKAKRYPFLLVSNHPRWRMHAQLDHAIWLREITPLCKIKGPDGYYYEPAWINPVDAERLGIKTGDIIKVYNDRGAVLCGAFVTERIMPGVIYVEHGSRVDLISLEDRIDRGGAINLIAPHEGGKNTAMMVVSGYLVGVEKVDIEELKRRYPEAFQRKLHPVVGPCYETYVIEGEKLARGGGMT